MGNLYVVTMYNYWLGVGGQDWLYKFLFAYGEFGIDDKATNEDDITPQDFVFGDDWAEPLIDWWKALHLSSVYLDRITVSTARRDSRLIPSDPESYGATEATPFPVAVYGERAAGGIAPLGLEQTLFVRKVVGSGNQGRLNLRGVLKLDDVTASAQGATVLVPGSTVATGGEADAASRLALTSAQFIGAPPEYTGLRMMVGTMDPENDERDPNARPVKNMIPAGVKPRSLHNNNRMTGTEKARRKLQREGYTVTLPPE